MNSEDVGACLECLKQEYNRSRDELLKARNARLLLATVYYVVGFGLLGLLIGFLAGGSSTPIVSTVLPLLFALIGGAGGLYLAGVDLKAPETGNRLQLLGWALIAFTLLCLLGVTVGAALRLGIHAEHAVPLPSVGRGTATDLLQLAMLRRRLELLGVNDAEQTRILADAAVRIDDSLQPIPSSQLQILIDKANGLRGDLGTALARSEAQKAEVPEDVKSAYAAVVAFARALQPWTDTSRSARGMPRDLYKNAVEAVWFRLSHLAHPKEPETAAWLSQNDFADARLYQLFEYIHEEFRKRDELEWETGGQLAARMDAFLALSMQARRPFRGDDILPSISDSGSGDDKAKKSTIADEKKDGQKD
jgi:hypothetical protein